LKKRSFLYRYRTNAFRSLGRAPTEISLIRMPENCSNDSQEPFLSGRSMPTDISFIRKIAATIRRSPAQRAIDTYGNFAYPDAGKL